MRAIPRTSSATFDREDRPQEAALQPGIAHEVLAAMAAHDLREPLHAIQGFLSVMLNERAGPVTDIQRDFLSSMFHAAHRIERLINDIQVILTSGEQFVVAAESTDLLAHLEACRRELAPAARGADLTLALAPETHLDGGVDWGVWADPLRLEQMLLNLLENAIRYADPGTVVCVRLRRSPSRTLCVVENQAERLADEDPARWLAPFVRGSGSAQVAARGQGLGLAVVDYLARQHGGRVFLRRRGSVVAIGFTLPSPPT